MDFLITEIDIDTVAKQQNFICCDYDHGKFSPVNICSAYFEENRNNDVYKKKDRKNLIYYAEFRQMNANGEGSSDKMRFQKFRP